jgi:hypothetical protein
VLGALREYPATVRRQKKTAAPEKSIAADSSGSLGNITDL